MTSAPSSKPETALPERIRFNRLLIVGNALAAAVPLAIGLVAWTLFDATWPQVVQTAKYSAWVSFAVVYLAVTVIPIWPKLARAIGMSPTHPDAVDERDMAIDDRATRLSAAAVTFMLIAALIYSGNPIFLMIGGVGQIVYFLANAHLSRRM